MIGPRYVQEKQNFFKRKMLNASQERDVDQGFSNLLQNNRNRHFKNMKSKVNEHDNIEQEIEELKR